MSDIPDRDDHSEYIAALEIKEAETTEELKSIAEFGQINLVNLCDSCEQIYPECHREIDAIVLGSAEDDNICACADYISSFNRRIK